MRLTALATAAALASISAAAPAPAPEPQFDFGALLSGFTGGSSTGSGMGGMGGGLGGLFSGLTGGSGGAPSVSAAPILKTYETIKASVDKLNDAALKFSSNTTSPASVLGEVLAAGKATVAAYRAGTTGVGAVNGTVSLIAAIGFMQPRAGLTASVETALGTLVAKKDAIVAAKGSEQVLGNLKEQKSAAAAFSSAAVAKLPSLAQGIAASSAQKGVDVFDSAIAAFTSVPKMRMIRRAGSVYGAPGRL